MNAPSSKMLLACAAVLLGCSGEEHARILPEEPMEPSTETVESPPTLRIAGHGVVARPRLPARIDHALDGTLSVREAGRTVLLRPAEIAQGRGLPELGMALEVARTADHAAPWTIVTDDYRIDWPARFTLRAAADLDPGDWPYELALDGSGDHFLFLYGPLQGAENVPLPDRMVAPGMTMVGQGTLGGGQILWFELAYDVGGRPWRQRVYYLPFARESLFLLRVQGTKDAAATMFEAADRIAASFRPSAAR